MTAVDVRVKAKVPASTGLIVITQEGFPRRPDPSALFVGSAIVRAPKGPPVKKDLLGDDTIVIAQLGKIQPKDRAWSEEPFFIGARTSQKLVLETEVSADNLREPLKTSLEVEFRVEPQTVTLEQLLREAEPYRKRS